MVVGICMDCVYTGLGSCVFVLGKSLGFVPITRGLEMREQKPQNEHTGHVCCPSSEIPSSRRQNHSIFWTLVSQQSRP